MGPVLLALRLVLAGVFAVAGGAKLADLEGSRRAVAGFGVPERLARPLGLLLPLLELAVAVALIPTDSARYGALGAAVLLLSFVAGISVALARGLEPDCHCFGQLRSAPVGWRALARNLALLAIAGFVAVAGWDDAGVSATRWVTDVGAAWVVAIAAALVIAALIGFQVWFCLQLLSQNGRVLARLHGLEAAVAQLSGESVPSSGPAPLGAGLAGGGLSVGAVAPGFSLPAVGGDEYSLEQLLSGERPLMLVFTDARCGPCDALMPYLARWQDDYAGRLGIALIASGDRERNVAKAAEHGIEPVLLQTEREVAESYGANGTPMAVVIGADGRIRSPTVAGAEAIGRLVAQATAPALTVMQVPSGNGHRHGAEAAPAPRVADAPPIGGPAPELVLSNLDGDRVALTDLYGERTVAIFWDPDCGFCQRMLDDLRALEGALPAGAPQLVLITSGDPERVREQGFRSQVLLDPDGDAMRAFAAGGTPMAVLIDERRIGSPVAAGADAVFGLIHDATAARTANGRGR
jgi:thiol-disulfide isomerase/thioredoxin